MTNTNTRSVNTICNNYDTYSSAIISTIIEASDYEAYII
jgi:hypothetical protein